MLEVDKHLLDHLQDQIKAIETHFVADFLFYCGEMHPAYERPFRDCVEELGGKHRKENPSSRIVIGLNTPGGSAETVEKMVNIIRHHYDEVYFIVPDYAMSAGTILCMSGNKIFMDYASALGPIDPQVQLGRSGEYIPALGYLDKVNEMMKKKRLTVVEMMLLQKLDLGLLRSFEQAKDLTVSLLKKWLFEYKFKDWTVHRTHKVGKAVTKKDKERRAEEIAKELGDNKKWHSHGRNIDIKKLRDLRLEIEDYSTDENLRKMIRSYNDMLTDYIGKSGINFIIHTKHGPTAL